MPLPHDPLRRPDWHIGMKILVTNDRFVAAFNFFGTGVKQEAASQSGDSEAEGDDSQATADAAPGKHPSQHGMHVRRPLDQGLGQFAASDFQRLHEPSR